jgi:arabinose-5-phosphate isomerase
MLEDLFKEQRRYLNHFFDHVDLSRAEHIFKTCLACKGLMIFTGVGKSGIIAEKIAMTLTSTGTKALFLPPVNFLHGDIGIVSQEDLVVLISKSGETEELLNLLPFIRRRKAGSIAFVSNPHSRLAKSCDHFISLPVEKELCPFDLAPTTSTAIQLIFGDILAVALMRAKGFSVDEYAKSHPSGALGKKMTLIVEDLMVKGDGIPLCRPSDRLAEVLVELSNKKCGCLLIADRSHRLLGIFTDGDLRRALQTHGPSVLESRMETLMTPSAYWTTKDALAWEAMREMQRDPKKWIMVLPVLEGERVVGIIRMHDIIQTGLSA